MLAGDPHAGCRRDLDRASQHRFEVLTRHPAGPQDGRVLAGDVDDRRLDADLAGSAVQHEVDGVTELRADVIHGGGADRAEAVGGRSRDATSESRQQREGDGMVGHAYCHRLQPAGRLQGDPPAAPQDQCQRSGPEAPRQQARGRGHLFDPLVQLLGGGDVDDQRVGGGRPLVWKIRATATGSSALAPRP